MKANLLFCIIAAFSIFFPTTVCAQTTHAHSSSRQWKGIDVLDVLANPGNYPGVTGSGIPVYLYNVGTGKFAIDGGDWGMEARLFYEDFGRQMMLKIQDGVLKIDASITHTNGVSEKCMLTCNVPGITKGNTWKDASSYSLTTILDGYIYWGKWNFQRIPGEDSSSEYHTYYMYQQHNTGQAYTKIKAVDGQRLYQGVDVKNIIFRFGAAWGEWCSDGTTIYNDNSTNNKGCGYYVHIDDDRSCWTTAGNANNSEVSPWGNQTTVQVGNEMIPIDELYQWRIISEEEFRQVLTEEVIGINPSISSLVPDRDFTRNSDDFFGYWITEATAPTTPDAGEGRYGFTWGNINKEYNQNYEDKNVTDPILKYPYRYNDEAWSSPVELKMVFDNIKNAKFGYMAFEGIGTVSASFQVPQPGWYQVEANVISFSSNPAHDTYMYAKSNWVTVTDALRQAPNNAFQGYSEVILVNEPNIASLRSKYSDAGFSNGNLTKNNQTVNNAIGKVLTFHGEDYRHKFWIYLNPTNFAENDDNKRITIGFRKDYATKSTVKNVTGSDVNYYFDEDWICVDDIKVSYMGLAPVFFYEQEQNLDYLVFDANYINERPSAQPNGMYSGALSLERTMKKNELNSFSFPIPLTGEQIRLAFGEEAELLELNSIGEISHNSKIIDFTSVELKPIDATAPVVLPGKLYLLKPTIDPVTGKDPLGRLTDFYQLGRNFFSVDATQVPDGYSHTIIDTTIPYASENISSWNDENDGVSHVSYISTPGGFDLTGNKIFPIDANGIYNGADIIDGLYVPNGAYVISTANVNGEDVHGIFEVNKDTPVKGFRGWITLTTSIFSEDESTPNAIIAINGVINGKENATGISTPQTAQTTSNDDTTVYDLYGRKIGTLGRTSLRRGIYIVAGRKVLIR